MRLRSGPHRAQRRCIAQVAGMFASGLCVAIAAGMAHAADFKPTQVDANPDRNAGLQAFAHIQRVLLHPRCLNCHVPDSPLQGINKHVHYPPVQRGKDGHGVAPMQCSTCHSVANGALVNSPPGLEKDGKPAWHMPPANMKMNWVGLSGASLCRAVREPKTNNGKSLAAIEEHMVTDNLVAWGWQPGPGREPPPLEKSAFDEQVRTWIRNGAPCDEREPLRKSVGETKAESAKRLRAQQAEADKELLEKLPGLSPLLPASAQSSARQ
jgi:hypothetical protein